MGDAANERSGVVWGRTQSFQVEQAMSNTPSKAEIEALVKRHGATSYRNRADTQHSAYGFTEDGLNGLIDEVLAKWGTPAQAAEPVA